VNVCCTKTATFWYRLPLKRLSTSTMPTRFRLRYHYLLILPRDFLQVVNCYFF
jgi:hypothetical protein